MSVYCSNLICSFRREGFVLDESLKDCWARFTDKSDEKFFRKFAKGFVAQWESKVCPSWEMMVTARLEGERDEGPRLAELPEELLPALSKYLFVGEDEAEEVRMIEGEGFNSKIPYLHGVSFNLQARNKACISIE